MQRWINKFLNTEPGFIEAVVMTVLCLMFVLCMRGGW